MPAPASALCGWKGVLLVLLSSSPKPANRCGLSASLLHHTADYKRGPDSQLYMYTLASSKARTSSKPGCSHLQEVLKDFMSCREGKYNLKSVLGSWLTLDTTFLHISLQLEGPYLAVPGMRPVVATQIPITASRITGMPSPKLPSPRLPIKGVKPPRSRALADLGGCPHFPITQELKGRLAQTCAVGM